MIISDRWVGFFGPLCNLPGVESLTKTFFDDPAFIEEMKEAVINFIITMMDRILDVIEVDDPWIIESTLPKSLHIHTLSIRLLGNVKTGVARSSV